MTAPTTSRAHVRGSVYAWVQLDKARTILLGASHSEYVDKDVLLSLVDDIQTEQDRLITLRPSEAP